MERTNLVCKPQKEYELLDSGEEEKLERFGSIVLARPDPQALWPKKLAVEEWLNADGSYERTGREGVWHTKEGFPRQWEILFGAIRFNLRATSFKHTGIFPEQLANWEWMHTQYAQSNSNSVKVLNLFAYTGGATIVAAQSGAQVTHVDASKTAVSWARENADLSGVGDAPIRWIVDDVLTFLRREVKRGNTYDAILMDPPAFGHGPKDELWKIEENLLELLELSQKLLSDTPLFVLISGYAAGYSPLALAYNLERFKQRTGGAVECGDLLIEEKGSNRCLPSGIFGRWHA